MIKFSKYHGCGNDFIIVKEEDVHNINYSTLALKMCNRYTGIGADGLIVVGNAPITMNFYNQDGSLGTMCGNGLRCMTRYIYDNDITSDLMFDIQTLAGVMKVKIISVNPFIVEANLGSPSFDTPMLEMQKLPFINQVIKYHNQDIYASAIFMGTKHLVVWVDNLEETIKSDLGAYLSNHPMFHDRINVDFVQIISNEYFLLKTYERGVGFTKACGTGCAAAYAVGKLQNKCFDKVTIEMEVGSLEISGDGNEIVMKGPAVKVAAGEYEN